MEGFLETYYQYFKGFGFVLICFVFLMTHSLWMKTLPCEVHIIVAFILVFGIQLPFPFFISFSFSSKFIYVATSKRDILNSIQFFLDQFKILGWLDC